MTALIYRFATLENDNTVFKTSGRCFTVYILPYVALNWDTRGCYCAQVPKFILIQKDMHYMNIIF